MRLLLCCFCALALTTVTVVSQSFESLRDPEVLYFDGKPHELPSMQLQRLTPLFTDKDLRTLIQNIQPKTKIRVLGWHSQGWLVQSMEGTSFEGWVEPSAVQGVTEEAIQSFRDKSNHTKSIREAINQKNIIPGMTYDEVKAALGKPTQTTFRVDEKGRVEVWSYIRYENIPQTNLVRDAMGNLYQTTIMIKVPKGEMKVEFKDGKVTAYEEKK